MTLGEKLYALKADSDNRRDGTIGERLAAIKSKSVESAAVARANRAEDNRKSMPQVTAWVDSTREIFGDVRVVYASEAGRTIGAKGPDGVKLSETLVGPWNRKKDAKKS